MIRSRMYVLLPDLSTVDRPRETHIQAVQDLVLPYGFSFSEFDDIEPEAPYMVFTRSLDVTEEDIYAERFYCLGCETSHAPDPYFSNADIHTCLADLRFWDGTSDSVRMFCEDHTQMYIGMAVSFHSENGGFIPI